MFGSSGVELYETLESMTEILNQPCCEVTLM
jgi:hypothetical protein